MATGPNWGDPLAPNAQGLWKLLFKFNTEQNSFNTSFHLAERTEAQAIAVGVDLAARLKVVMPASAEIYDAIVSKDNGVKDGRFIPSALGVGSFVSALVPPVSDYDFSKTALLVRMETAGGGSVSLKLSMLPDEKVLGGTLVTTVPGVVGMPGALPAAPNPADAWELSMTNLLKAIVFQCHAVKSGYVPGEQYTYFAFQNAYPKRLSAKKGGRVFSA